MAVTVTGANGQLGGHLVPRLRKQGLSVYECDLQPGDGESFLRLDLTSLPAGYRWPDDVDVVVHLAGSRDPIEPSASYIRGQFVANIETVAGALCACGERVKHFIYISSISVYSQRACVPITESEPADPVDIYGYSKWLGEQACRLYEADHPGFGLTVLRLAQVYGPGSGRHLALYRLIDQALSGEPLSMYCVPELQRDYIYVDDAVAAIELAVERRLAGTYNVGSGQGVTMEELADSVRMAAGITQPSSFGDYRGHDLALSIDGFRGATGFVPGVSLQNGVAREVERLRAAQGNQA